MTDFHSTDFATARQPSNLQAQAYALADAMGYVDTFSFNKALQGATHALAGRHCEHSDPDYVSGYQAASDA